jgi:hypothetical protein
MAMPIPHRRAIAEQAGRLDQLIFAGWTHRPAQDLAAGLVTITGLPYAFFPIRLHLRRGRAENGAGPLAHRGRASVSALL